MAALIICSLSGSSFAATAFFDNMENGDGAWNATGFWHRVTNPQNICVNSSINPALVTLPDSGCLPHAYSGSSAWWFGEDSTGTYIGADYDPLDQESKNGGFSRGANSGVLWSPIFNLTYASAANVSFKTWWEIESHDPTGADYMDVYLSSSSLVQGQTVYLGTLNPVIDYNGSEDIPCSTGGFDQPGVWIEKSYDLDDYVAGPFDGSVYRYRMRFEFHTWDKNYNGFRGWLIDDLNVSVAREYPEPEIYSVQPSSGYSDATVNIFGTGFMDGARVSIDGMQCTNASVMPDMMITVSLPAGLTPGIHDVTVTNPTNTSYTLSNAFELISNNPTTTTTTTSSTTTTNSCTLAGDHPPCGEVTVTEILGAITLWAQGNMQIADVLNLITAWANG